MQKQHFSTVGLLCIAAALVTSEKATAVEQGITYAPPITVGNPLLNTTTPGTAGIAYDVFKPIPAPPRLILDNGYAVSSALVGNSTDPMGNVELLTPHYLDPARPVCLSGSFATSGDDVTVCSLTAADWASTDVTGRTLARRYYDDFMDAYPGLETLLDEEFAANCPNLDPYFSFFLPALEPVFSDPNVSYINQETTTGTFVLSLAGQYNATQLFAYVLDTICPGFDYTRLADFTLQASEVVKIYLNGSGGANPLYAYSFRAIQSGRYADNNTNPEDLSPDCQQNLNWYRLVYGTQGDPYEICSASGNFELLFPLDYGDLPEPYPTRLAVDGARHVILSQNNPMLGAIEDIEPDGYPTASATGDNIDNRNDEDGVIIPPLERGTTVQIWVLYNNPTGSTVYLNAWLDIDGDGVLDQIAIDRPIPPGPGFITIPVSIPATATLGNVYGRFRISSQRGLGLTGLAPDGEVEDYRATITEPGEPPEPPVPPKPNPIPAVSAVTLAGTVTGLLLIGAANIRRRRKR